MLEALQYMSIKERIEYNVCQLVYKIVNGMCPEYLSDNIRTVQWKETRQRQNIYIDKCRSREEQRMLLHDGLKMFNSLPNEIKEQQNVRDFRKMLVQYITKKDRKVWKYENIVICNSKVAFYFYLYYYYVIYYVIYINDIS